MAAIALSSTSTANERLLKACTDGNVDLATAAIKEGAEPYYQETKEGKSALMAAAASGSKELVELLLENGAPWNAVDRRGKCAGEYAVDKAGEAGQSGDAVAVQRFQVVIDTIVSAGVRAELILGTLEKKRRERLRLKNASQAIGASVPSENSDLYLQRNVRYEGDNLMDSEDDAVMMQWESPLMRAHTEVLCDSKSDVLTAEAGAAGAGAPAEDRGMDILNIGFGMGIFDTAVEEKRTEAANTVRRHWICEAHPGVLRKMIADGWHEKENVVIVFARWQDALGLGAENEGKGKDGGGDGDGDVVSPAAAAAAKAAAKGKDEELPPGILGAGALVGKQFDGIFFDTYGEYFADMQVFHAKLPSLLRVGGRYSFFNGLCPDNIFFHGAICQIVQIEMAALGLQTEFIPVGVDSTVVGSDEEGSGGKGDGAKGQAQVWKGVKRKYWQLETYYLPVCVRFPKRKD